jgi:hypothetical protein
MRLKNFQFFPTPTVYFKSPRKEVPQIIFCQGPLRLSTAPVYAFGFRGDYGETKLFTIFRLFETEAKGSKAHFCVTSYRIHRDPGYEYVTIALIIE